MATLIIIILLIISISNNQLNVYFVNDINLAIWTSWAQFRSFILIAVRASEIFTAMARKSVTGGTLGPAQTTLYQHNWKLALRGTQIPAQSKSCKTKLWLLCGITLLCRHWIMIYNFTEWKFCIEWKSVNCAAAFFFENPSNRIMQGGFARIARFLIKY